MESTSLYSPLYLHFPLHLVLCKFPGGNYLSSINMFSVIITDMLAYHLVYRWIILMSPVEPPPHGQREQDPGSPRPDNPVPLLHAWCSGWVGADIPRYQVLQVPCLAGYLAQDEEIARVADVVCCFYTRTSLD